MSTSTNSEKFKPLSVFDRSRLVTEPAMRTKAAEKALNASNHYQKVTLNRLKYKLLPDDKGKILILRAECYNLINFKLLI